MNKNNMNHTMIHRIVLAAAALVLLCFQHVAGQTMRGDFNMDGSVNLTDVTTMISYMINEELPFTGLDKDTVTVNGVSFVMVRVQGGTYSRELYTCRTVGDFSIGQTEVTFELWRAVMGEVPVIHPSDERCPISNLSWQDCQRFITKLNELTGMQFRLPIQDEWEYAATGGRLTRAYRYAGSDNLADVGWFVDNIGENVFGYPVGSKAPNELGLYDMSGNASEWCQDARYMTVEGYAALYGGSVYSSADDCRPTRFLTKAVSYSEWGTGLRLAL